MTKTLTIDVLRPINQIGCDAAQFMDDLDTKSVDEIAERLTTVNVYGNCRSFTDSIEISDAMWTAIDSACCQFNSICHIEAVSIHTDGQWLVLRQV